MEKNYVIENSEEQKALLDLQIQIIDNLLLSPNNPQDIESLIAIKDKLIRKSANNG